MSGFPIRGPKGILAPLNQILGLQYTRFAHEDYSAFGPLGIVALVAAMVLAVWAYEARRAELPHFLLALPMPLFLILVARTVAWNPFLLRFFLVPAALVAPLLARLFQSQSRTAAYMVVAALTVGLTLTRSQTKPLLSPLGAPWHLTEVEALNLYSRHQYDQALPAFEARVPTGACVGVILGDSEPSFLLFGPRLKRRVVYLPVGDSGANLATEESIPYVLVSTNPQPEALALRDLENAGWRADTLGGHWYLASDPRAKEATCPT